MVSIIIKLMVAYKELAVENFLAAIEAIKETWRNS
tara:strand:- start:128 stop:232 length:105 start_codon:yes stop_codon:yes gene_type:complete